MTEETTQEDSEVTEDWMQKYTAWVVKRGEATKIDLDKQEPNVINSNHKKLARRMRRRRT